MSQYPYPDRSDSGRSQDYVSQHGRNDPYRRKDDPYSRNDDPYRRNDDPYRRNDDPYRRNDDPYRRSDDPYRRSDDPYRRNDDPYKRNDDPNKRNDDPHKRNDGQYRRKDDPYRRNDPYGNRDDLYGRSPSGKASDDPYARRPHDGYGDRKPTGDGFHSDSYKSSGDIGGYNFKHPDPVIYEVDHLVTFDVSPKLGVKNFEDGLDRLRRMEMTSGVWTMRYLLSIDDREIVITEKASRKELESFPISRVHDPVNITNPQEIYNDIVIFVVENESSRNASEMHFFQCIGKPGHDLKDDIEAARIGKFPRPPKEKRSSVSSQERGRPHSGRYEDGPVPVPMNGKPPSRNSSTPVLDSTEADIEVLNRCFDNIESFVASLQQAANAQKKLDLAHKNPAANPNELQFLMEKARPPPAREFIDTFQKFKLALNLLPKVKHIVKDPNAQELTHLLFSPLALVVQASCDPQGQPKLAASVTAPLLTRDTCLLLDTSLHSTELSLWRQLGDAWNIPQESWKGTVPPPYVPRFMDNSKPARLQGPVPGSDFQGNHASGSHQPDDMMRNGAGGVAGIPNPVSQSTAQMKPPDTQGPQMSSAYPTSSAAFSPQQEEFLRSLKERNAKVCRVIHSRVSNNPKKELTVNEGEFVEVLENAKKWWKVSNINNQSGYVPNTILTAV